MGAPSVSALVRGRPALIRTDEPRFSAKKLGFEDFTALLDFAEAINTGREPTCSAQAGYEALELVESIYTSCRTGEKQVLA